MSPLIVPVVFTIFEEVLKCVVLSVLPKAPEKNAEIDGGLANLACDFRWLARGAGEAVPRGHPPELHSAEAGHGLHGAAGQRSCRWVPGGGGFDSDCD